MTTASRNLFVACLVSCAVPLLGGCGYQHAGSMENAAGYKWHTLYRDDIKTVAVPIFGNRTYYRDIEFRLTKAVVNQLEAQSPYKVVARERADTVLEGEIERVRVHTISNSQITALPQEQLLIMTVRFSWRDLRTGKMLVERHNFEQTAAYYPTIGEGQFVGQQENVERLALAIVQELQADWGNP